MLKKKRNDDRYAVKDISDRQLHELTLFREKTSNRYAEMMRKAETLSDMEFFYRLLNNSIHELKHVTAEILRRQIVKEKK